MRTRIVIAVIIASSASAGEVSAQERDTTTLRTVVVSATKTPAERASLTQAVTVITGDDIRAKGIVRLSDALREVPGAMLVQNGSIGSVNTLFLRGGDSRYTKVLIDGVAVNAPGGFFDFSHLTTDNIERIEVVRGAAGVVHGADAVAGVIQIFTRQGRGPISLSADARAGTLGTREVSVATNGGTSKARYSLGGGAHRTDGVLDFNNQYYNGTLSASAGFNPAEGTDVSVTSRYTAAEFHYPTDYTGIPVDSNSYRVQHRLTVGLDASRRLSPGLIARLRAGTNEVSDLTEDLNLPFGVVPPIPYKTRLLSRNKRRSAEIGLSASLPASSTLAVGAEYMNEDENSVNSEGLVGAPQVPSSSFAGDRNNKALYGELNGSLLSRASYTVGAHVDDNSEYDAHATYRVGASVPLTQSIRARASINSAFNAPAFNQLRSTLYTVGNPDLDPERSTSWEIGAEQTMARGRLRLSASYFAQRFDDIIQFVSGGPPDFVGTYENLTQAESNGFDVEAELHAFRELTAAFGYTFVEPRVSRVSADYSGDLKPGDALLRRPKHSGNASVTWSRSGFASLSAVANVVGKRPDMDFTQFPSPVVTLPFYAKFDVAGSAEVLRSKSGRASVGLTFRIENVLDREYEEVLNFPAPGRAVLIGARISGSL